MTYTHDEVFAATLEYFNNDEIPTNIWINKYALRDKEGNLLEKTPTDMHRRLAKEIARIEKKKFSNPLSEDEIFSYLDKFERIIPQGSPMFGIGNKYQYISLSNCFVTHSPDDSYGGIFTTDEELAHIFKRRGGAGTTLDYLRPNNAPTSNSSKTSTGVISFMERYSNTSREVGQAGRRAALMITLNIHHPDAVSVLDEKEKDSPIIVNPNMEYLGIKPIKISKKYYNPDSIDFTSIKYDRTKVTGANISLKITDAFMEAVAHGTEFQQQWPVISDEPKIVKFIDAKRAWDKIITAAHQVAEPGIIFWDNVLNESIPNCYSKFGFTEESTNPCCFSYDHDHFVLTRDGLKEIKTITSEDEVWVPTLQKWCSTSGYFEAGNAPIYEIVFDNNSKIYVTKNHNIYTDKFKLSNLDNGLTIDTHPCYYLENNTIKVTGIKSISYVDVGLVGCIEVYERSELVVNGIISSNSELPLCSYDSCRLLCLNLFGYIKNPFSTDAYFDFEQFYEDSKIAQRFMDDIVDIEIEMINRIIKKIKTDPESISIKQKELSLWNKVKEKAEMGRRTGTGITALGDTVAALNLKYDSPEALDVIEKIYQTLKFGSYTSSMEMAKELGAFPIFDHSLEKNNPFLNRIKDEELQLSETKTLSGQKLYNQIKKYGRRNIALLTTAPTGTVSLLAKIGPYHGTTSGIEPLFKASYLRRVKLTEKNNLSVDFIDQSGDKWHNFTVYHNGVKLWMELTGEKDISLSPYHLSSANDIDWQLRVELQSRAQKHVDHSISSTINLPEDVSVEEVKKIYETAHAKKLKGITVYRENCRSGVLLDTNHTDNSSYVKRPKELPASIYHFNLRGNPYFTIVGLIDDKPYEIFAGKNGILNKKYTTGIIKKIKRGKYSLICDDEVVLESITDFDDETEEALTRMVSTSLRHKIPIEFVVHQLEKVEGDMYCLAKSMARALKKFIPNNTKVTGASCEGCSSTNLARQEGCVTCFDCGWSKCG